MTCGLDRGPRPHRVGHIRLALSLLFWKLLGCSVCYCLKEWSVTITTSEVTITVGWFEYREPRFSSGCCNYQPLFSRNSIVACTNSIIQLNISCLWPAANTGTTLYLLWCNLWNPKMAKILSYMVSRSISDCYDDELCIVMQPVVVCRHCSCIR